MIETGRIKFGRYDVVYLADFNIKVTRQVMTDTDLWNTHYKVLRLLENGIEKPYVMLMEKPDEWREVIHKILYWTAGDERYV